MSESGRIPDVLARISAAPIDQRELEAFVRSRASGAVVTFSGVVRDHDDGRAVVALDYEAHPDAERFLRECCEEVARRTGLRVAAVHRVGSLQLGDTALVAAAAAAHRREAFEACSDLVERIKSTIPVWKRQHFESGVSEWVGL